MMKKLIPITLMILLLSGCAPVPAETCDEGETDCGPDEQARAIELAKEVYEAEVRKGTDLSNGPCIAELLMPDWVADIAHDPRLPVDDLPENQCSMFREGNARHFVELDEQGNVIKVY